MVPADPAQATAMVGNGDPLHQVTKRAVDGV
jgi:hypothetical protein